MHKGSVVAKFIRQSLSGEEWEVYGDGNQTRDFVYVADLVDAIQRAGTTPGVGGEVFQIATNAETTVNQLIAVMQQVLGEMGAPAGRVLHTATRTGDVLRNYSDTSKAREQLGWQAEHSLREGIAKTIAWFLSSPAAKAA
jgi:UDP-glucose 4-epimerase